LKYNLDKIVVTAGQVSKKTGGADPQDSVAVAKDPEILKLLARMPPTRIL
jgi:hypothetical protein